MDTSRRIVHCTAAGDRLPVPWAPSRRSTGTREDGNGNPGARPWTAWTETGTAWMAAGTAWMAAENPWARDEASIEIATGNATGNGSAANLPITSNRPITARPYARASRTNDGAAAAPGGRLARGRRASPRALPARRPAGRGGSSGETRAVLRARRPRGTTAFRPARRDRHTVRRQGQRPRGRHTDRHTRARSFRVRAARSHRPRRPPGFTQA